MRKNVRIVPPQNEYTSLQTINFAINVLVLEMAKNALKIPKMPE